MFNIFEARLCCNTLSSENQIGTTRFSGSFVRINQLLCTYLTTPTQSTSFGVLFASLLSGWTTTTVMDCLARMGNMRKESFPRTQRRICQFKNQTRVSNLYSTLNHYLSLPLFQVKAYDLLCYDRIFLSFECLRSKNSHRIICKKNPFSHFFAFWVGFRRYCCRTFDVLRRNHSRAISNFSISRSYYCAIRSFYEVFCCFGFEIFFSWKLWFQE